MKIFSKTIMSLLSLILISAILLSGCGQQTATNSSGSDSDTDISSQNSSDNTEKDGDNLTNLTDVRLQDDFYTAVNAQWLMESVIPDDQPTDNPMQTLDKEVTQTLISDFKAMMESEDDVDGALGEFIKLYRMQLDYDTREQLGTEPLKPFLDKIESINNFDDLNSVLYDMTISGYAFPFMLTVAPSVTNSEINVLNAISPGLLLMTKDYYAEEVYGSLAPIYSAMAEQMMVLVGKTQDEAKSIVESAMAFDMLLSEYALSMEEQSNYAALYSEITFDEFASYSSNIDFGALTEQLIGEIPENLIISNKKHFEALDTIVSEENFEDMKNWMLYNITRAYSSYLTEELDLASLQYSMALMGITQPLDKEERNFGYVRQMFSPVIGQYYGETYFGEENKKEVTEITQSIIATYKEKLSNNDWLSEATREKALTKLDSIVICMGYPNDDQIDPFYNEYKILTEESLIDNLDKITRKMQEYTFSQYGKPHDKNIWTATGDTVNAFYNPINNTVSFTAAIMQEPFYPENGSMSEKYGAFGSIVGHEVSHAFDPNGAMFDENGNLNNWWTEEDFATFEEKTQAIFAQFDGLPYAGGVVNAALTNSENVADNAGIKASFDTLKQTEEFDAEDFFISWAKVWRTNSTPEYEAQLLMLDNHAPSPLRVNIPLMNFDEFHELVGTTENDKMFRPQSERIFVW